MSEKDVRDSNSADKVHNDNAGGKSLSGQDNSSAQLTENATDRAQERKVDILNSPEGKGTASKAVKGYFSRSRYVNIKRPFNITYHALIIAGLSLLLLIPQLFFNLLLSERQGYLHEAKHAIMQPWGDELHLAPPVLSVPIYKYKRGKRDESELHILADKVKVAIDIKATERKKGFYSASVYTAHVIYKGQFSTRGIKDALVNYTIDGVPYLRVLQDKNAVIEGINHIKINGKEYEPAIGKRMLVYESVQIPAEAIGSSENDIYSFEIDIVYRGGEEFVYQAFAGNNSIEIKGSGILPGFGGDTLPAEYNLSDKTFDAKYNITNISGGMSRFTLDDYVNRSSAKSITVDLKQGFDQYTLVERLTKYVLLFIAITFGTVFVFEMVTKKFLSTLQFLVIGLALIMFYMVLLSLSEYIVFYLAYIIAAVIMVAMISLYIKGLFKDNRLALIMCAMVSATYGILFAIIHSHNYALLIGTATMLTLLGVIMFFTSKLGLTDIKEQQ